MVRRRDEHRLLDAQRNARVAGGRIWVRTQADHFHDGYDQAGDDDRTNHLRRAAARISLTEIPKLPMSPSMLSKFPVITVPSVLLLINVRRGTECLCVSPLPERARSLFQGAPKG